MPLGLHVSRLSSTGHTVGVEGTPRPPPGLMSWVSPGGCLLGFPSDMQFVKGISLRMTIEQVKGGDAGQRRTGVSLGHRGHPHTPGDCGGGRPPC